MHNPTFLNNWYYLPTWNNDVADSWLGMSDMALTWHWLDTHVVGRRHGKHDMDTAWQSHDVAWMTWKLHGRHVANCCTWLTLHNEWTCYNCCIVWTHSKPFLDLELIFSKAIEFIFLPRKGFYIGCLKIDEFLPQIMDVMPHHGVILKLCIGQDLQH